MSAGKPRFTYGGNVLGLGGLILGIYVGQLLDHVDPWLQWGCGGATAVFCIMWFNDWTCGRGLSPSAFLQAMLLAAGAFCLFGGITFVNTLVEMVGNPVLWLLVFVPMLVAGMMIWLGLCSPRRWVGRLRTGENKGLLG